MKKIKPTKRDITLQKVADTFAERLFGVSLSQAHAEMICIECRRHIGKFLNEIDQREYEISGLCTKCQDKLFKEVE